MPHASLAVLVTLKFKINYMECVAGKIVRCFNGGGLVFDRVGISGLQQNKDQKNKKSAGVEKMRAKYLH
jgi:hypothetical protein